MIQSFAEAWNRMVMQKIENGISPELSTRQGRNRLQEKQMLMRVRERISRGVITPFILFIYYFFPVCPFISRHIHSLFLLSRSVCVCMRAFYAHISCSFFSSWFFYSEFVAILFLPRASFTANMEMLQLFVSTLSRIPLRGMMSATALCESVWYRSLSVLLTETETQWTKMHFIVFIQWWLNWNLSLRHQCNAIRCAVLCCCMTCGPTYVFFFRCLFFFQTIIIDWSSVFS